MSDNLTLWHAVERTPEAHTKPITGKQYSGTSPKPYYLIQRATETFGPCGIGWGFEIADEKVIDGALLEPGFYERIHMARVRVWYEWEGKRGTVEHVGQTQFSGRRKDGKPFTDEDAPKKSVTDALVKALSMIGFAGDIFIGRYDDSKYVAELKREAAQQQDNAAEERTRKAEQTRDDLVRSINDCDNEPDLIALVNDVRFKEAVDALPDNNKREVRSTYKVKLTAIQKQMSGDVVRSEAAE